jgi:hypothetical protein
MRAPSHRFKPIRDAAHGYVITRYSFDAPRLVEVTSCDAQGRFIHGRDVTRGGALRVRQGDVIARHEDYHAALSAWRALTAALPEIDAQVFRARAAYDKAVRQRLKAQAAIAAGAAKAGEARADAA